MSSKLYPSTRQERLSEVREFVLKMLDEEYLPWRIKSECERYIRSKWDLSRETVKDYVECTLTSKDIRDIIVQQEKRRRQKSSI